MWKNNDIAIKHLSIDIIDGEIIYKRKLVDGPSETKYGLEIAKCLGIHNDIINDAINIRNDFLNKTNKIMPTTKSKYNADKFIKN